MRLLFIPSQTPKNWTDVFSRKFKHFWCKYRFLIIQKRSPRILLASWRSLDMMVTLFAWMAQRLVSSKRETRYASAASWRAKIAWLWNLISCLNSVAISLTNLWKGSFLINKSVWINKKEKKECGRWDRISKKHLRSFGIFWSLSRRLFQVWNGGAFWLRKRWGRIFWRSSEPPTVCGVPFAQLTCVRSVWFGPSPIKNTNKHSIKWMVLSWKESYKL